jgi:hypothetical protein
VQDITITQLTDTVIKSSSESNSNKGNSQQTTDIELVKEIQKRIIVVDNSRQLRDNVRKNTFKNKNQNVVCISSSDPISQL